MNKWLHEICYQNPPIYGVDYRGSCFFQYVMRFAELTQEVQIARSENVHFDTGLAKGRRKMHQQYRENLANAHAEGGEISYTRKHVFKDK